MNRKLASLIQQHEDVLAKARAITDGLGADEDLSEVEQVAVGKYLDDAGELQDKIRVERGLEAEALTAPAERIGQSNTLSAAGGIGLTTAELFPDVSRSNDGFDSAEEFLRALHSGNNDPRFMAAAGSASEGIGEDGGFLVPTEFAFDLMDASLENEVVRPGARVVPMKFSSKRTAGFDTQNHTGGSIGGFTAGWIGEGTQLQLQKGKVRLIDLQARKLAILSPASNELLSDGAEFSRLLNVTLRDGMTWSLDDAYLNGSGAGQPLGILNDPALISVAKVGSQAADTILYANIKAMFNRLHPGSVARAVWIVNANCREQLLGLIQPVTNIAGTENVGGSHVPAMREDGSGGFRLLGLEVLFTEKTPQLGDQGDIVLVDRSQYVIGLRKEVTVDISQHLRFDFDESVFRIIARSDAQGAWSAPITPKTGPTLSWCVTLDERA